MPRLFAVSPPRAAVSFAVWATAAALATAVAHTLLVAPAGTGTAPVEVRIPVGSDLRRIARILAQGGVVVEPGGFVLTARLAGLERRLRPGDYSLDPRLSLPTLVRSLVEGRGRSETVTIPEGWRLEQIAERLAAAGICDRDGFLAKARDPVLLAELGIPGPTAEGFLFPDTYAFSLPSEPAEAVRAMHRRFASVWRELTAGEPDPGPELLPTVTLASIVERETAQPAERPLVAGVFLNRLRRGMPLQADPTVIYGIDDFDGNVRRRDLRAANPYNTYVVRGLPPGPIAAPGRASLAAALHPAATDDLYFVARGDGSHHFSRTLGEHQRAVQRFQLTTGKRRG